MSCQKKIASQIVKQQADYLLAVKKNQRSLYNTIDTHFMGYWAQHPEDSPTDPALSVMTEAKHHRQEYRCCWIQAASWWPVIRAGG